MHSGVILSQNNYAVFVGFIYKIMFLLVKFTCIACLLQVFYFQFLHVVIIVVALTVDNYMYMHVCWISIYSLVFTH